MPPEEEKKPLEKEFEAFNLAEKARLETTSEIITPSEVGFGLGDEPDIPVPHPEDIQDDGEYFILYYFLADHYVVINNQAVSFDFTSKSTFSGSPIYPSYSLDENNIKLFPVPLGLGIYSVTYHKSGDRHSFDFNTNGVVDGLTKYGDNIQFGVAIKTNGGSEYNYIILTSGLKSVALYDMNFNVLSHGSLFAQNESISLQFRSSLLLLKFKWFAFSGYEPYLPAQVRNSELRICEIVDVVNMQDDPERLDIEIVEIGPPRDADEYHPVGDPRPTGVYERWLEYMNIENTTSPEEEPEDVGGGCVGWPMRSVGVGGWIIEKWIIQGEPNYFAKCAYKKDKDGNKSGKPKWFAKCGKGMHRNQERPIGQDPEEEGGQREWTAFQVHNYSKNNKKVTIYNFFLTDQNGNKAGSSNKIDYTAVPDYDKNPDGTIPKLTNPENVHHNGPWSDPQSVPGNGE